VGHPRRAGPALRLTGDLGRPLRVGEEGEEGERVLTSGAKRSEGERESACAALAGEERGADRRTPRARERALVRR
jgi:hypothetical protein